MSESTSSDFIRKHINTDNDSGKYGNRVHTRFPPEPNGFLHIGHTKALCINFGIAEDYDGQCNLRFDDTNPTTEEIEFVEGIKADIRWLGFDWEDRLYYASDYFGQLYDWAVQLIKQGDAYVDDLSAEEMRDYRGDFTTPGRNSPYRDRSAEENLDLFERMKNREFAEGERVLRAKIDMASSVMAMRDPVMYRILYTPHHRTGDEWCIYPMYDWAHGQSDSIEGITHSLCSLEFQNNRPLYNWFVEKLGIYAPTQIEFARLEITHVLTSKRKLRPLVEAGIISGWDDPRLATLSGMRRRGYPPEALKQFVTTAGIAKANSIVEYAQLEHAVRDHLNRVAPRAMAVLNPLKVVVTNYPEGETEYFDVANHPQDKANTETRSVAFTRELFIEREDFAEVPPRKYKRLSLGREVRFYGAYYLTANEVVKDDEGNIVEVHCTYDPESRGGSTVDRRKVKGTIHWVSAEHSLPATINLYNPLFLTENPLEGGDVMANVNPDSLEVLTNSRIEPALAAAQAGDRFQFMRMGYFTPDDDSTPDNLVFNRTITLRDGWAKIKKSSSA